MLLLFLFEVELRGDVVIQNLCAYHRHFTITLHFYFYGLLHPVDRTAIDKIIITSRDFLFTQNSVFFPIFSFTPNKFYVAYHFNFI